MDTSREVRFWAAVVRTLAVLGVGSLIGASSTAFGQDYAGARLIGFSGSQRALGTGNDAIYVNPAGMALGRAYSLELGYLDDARGSDRRFNASVLDSQSGPIAGGLAYTYSVRRPDDQGSGDERLQGHRFDLALATPLADSVALGVTLRYLTYSRKTGDTELDGGFSALTFDAGFQWRITEGLAFGLTGYNLTKSERPELPIGWGAGLGYESGGFSIESDVRYNATNGKARFSGGLGYAIADIFPIRVGVAYDRFDRSVTVSGGLGLVYQRFSADVAYEQRVNGDRVFEDDDRRILAIALRGHFM